MSPTIKDSQTLRTSQETGRSGSTVASPDDSPIKPQPVAMEIPITVNGARTVEGSDKREPFSESTKTVMVFGSGAVIRLSSAMAPGQLLFLVNERTKKEVVCQVVKSKSYRKVSGYVELEFTEPAVGFWGMRFPGDRIGPGPQAARPVAQSGEAPAANGSLSSPAAKPSAPAPASSKPTSTAPSFAKPAPSATAGSSIVPSPLDSAALLGTPKAKPNTNASPAPIATSLGNDTPLVEPWLKKREPAPRVPAVPPRAVAPEPPAKTEEPGPSLPPTRSFDLARPSDQPASLFAPSEPTANLAKVDLSSLTPFFEVKPASADTPQPPVPTITRAANDGETEDLKQRNARLQQELSKIQFAEPATNSPIKPDLETPAFPLTEQAISAIKTELVHDNAARLIEDSAPTSPGPVLTELPTLKEPPKATPAAPIAPLESLQEEEMRIPAWLEPLARNASAPSSTKELVLREKAKRIAEKSQSESQLVEVTAPLVARAEEEPVAGARVPQFGSALPFEEIKSTRERAARKSGKRMLVGAIAAGVLLLAGGGWWYMNQQVAGTHASASAVEATAASPASQDLQTSSTKEAVLGSVLPAHENAAATLAKPAATNSNAPVNGSTSVSSPALASSTIAATSNSPIAANSLKSGSSVASAAPAPAEVVPQEVKKPVLGDVHLAAPKISQKKAVQTAAEPDAGISLSEDQPEANAVPLGTGLGIANTQPAAPAAPIAVGGDVKQAKLISAVQPEYPALARAQHVSGGVTIDALIDDTGRVTKMKVISGPSLLHQAAMDALKRWKYQPAMLDGKPVPMHLSVTIQFRLQ